MTESLDEVWDRLTRTAASRDDRHRVTRGSCIPPIMRDLVAAARASSLGQFYPFTSHAWLRFRTVPNVSPWGGQVLSVMIGLTPDACYLVALLQEGGWDYPPTEVLKTDSASEAVAQAAHLSANRLSPAPASD